MRRVATGITEPSEGRAQAIAFLIDAYDGIRIAAGKGLPHAQAVADILRDAGYDQRVQVVGLLHDVVEDTPRSIQNVRDGSATRSPRWCKRSPKTTASATTLSASEHFARR
jgi:(p)ppGpp synthase/HD superfamily hydrolase